MANWARGVWGTVRAHLQEATAREPCWCRGHVVGVHAEPHRKPFGLAGELPADTALAEKAVFRPAILAHIRVVAGRFVGATRNARTRVALFTHTVAAVDVCRAAQESCRAALADRS